MSNFSSLPGGTRLRLNNNKAAQIKGKDEFAGVDLQCDLAFEPTEIYKLWNDSREEHVEGRQEDAEEFLGYVLNKLNDEMLEVGVDYKLLYKMGFIINMHYFSIGYQVDCKAKCPTKWRRTGTRYRRWRRRLAGKSFALF